MQTIINLTLPFFAVIGLGVLAVRLGMLDDKAARILNIFVFNFAMPALIGGALARQDFNALLDFDFLAGWFVAGAILFLTGMLLSRLFFKGTLGEMGLTGQAASISNIGFLGFPLIATTFGDAGLTVAATALVIDLVILIPLSFALLEASGGGGLLTTVKRVARGAILNPFVIAIAIGFFLSATGIGLPGPTDRFASFLASAAGPTALFALGVSLASRRIEGDTAAIGTMSFLKLVLHPVAAYAFLTLFGVDGVALGVGVILAAMPIAGNVFVIAQQYNVMVRRCSSAVLVSTVIAIVTSAIALDLVAV